MLDQHAIHFWIIVALAVLGTGAAILAFLKTPRERRYRGISLEERMQRYPPSAQAVIIKADRRRALRKTLPYVVCGLPPGLFVLWIGHTPHAGCETLLGVNAAYIAMLLLCYGLPVGLFLVSLSGARMGMRTLRTGYFPPLDAAVFAPTIATKGALARSRGAALIVLPFVMLYIISLGNDAYAAFAGGKSATQMIERLNAKCR
jgi:hypothetical protein